MIKTVLLDFGGVLAYPISGNWFIPYDLFKIAGFTTMLKMFVKKNRLNRAFIKGNEYLNENHQLATEEEEFEQFRQFFRIVFKEMKIKSGDRVIDKLATSIVYSDYQIKFYDDVVEGINALKEKYRVMIISDTWPSLKRRLDKEGVLKLLDGLIMSCEYNQTKETTDLFETAIKKLNLMPSECIFIDDSAGNLKNAEAVGFKPVLMDRRNNADESEYPIIKCLDDIKDIIEKLDAPAEPAESKSPLQ